MLLSTLRGMGQDSTYFRSIDARVDTVAPVHMLQNATYTSNRTVLLIRESNRSFCILNPSDSSVAIDRIDAQMDNVGSEIFVNGSWQTLQGVNHTYVTCGNSYCTMNLNPGYFIRFTFRIPDVTGGEAVKVRVFGTCNKHTIYSEPWIIHLNSYQIRQAGKPIHD